MGYGLTLSVVGAKVGVPLAVIGNGMSTVGSAMEIGVSLYNDDYGRAGSNVGFFLAEKTVSMGLNKVLPGAGKKIGQEGFNLGTEILTQGAHLKLIGTQRLINQEQDKSDK